MTADFTYGPAMAALSERKRVYVWARAAGKKRRAAADLAGYATGEHGGDPKKRSRILDKTACLLEQDPDIARAIAEVAGARIQAEAVASAQFLMGVMDDAKAPLALRMKAANSILDRAGLVGVQKIAVDHSHRHTDNTGEALIERARAAAVRLGMDPDELVARLSGGMTAPKVIEHDAIVSADVSRLTPSDV